MEDCQNFVLNPISVEDAICMPWRYKNSIRSDKKGDDDMLTRSYFSSRRMGMSIVPFTSCAAMNGIGALPAFPWRSSTQVPHTPIEMLILGLSGIVSRSEREEGRVKNSAKGIGRLVEDGAESHFNNLGHKHVSSVS